MQLFRCRPYPEFTIRRISQVSEVSVARCCSKYHRIDGQVASRLSSTILPAQLSEAALGFESYAEALPPTTLLPATSGLESFPASVW